MSAIKSSPRSLSWTKCVKVEHASERTARQKVLINTLTSSSEEIVRAVKPKQIVLLLEEYEDLLDDLQDLATAARRKHEGTISVSEVRKQMNKITALRR